MLENKTGTNDELTIFAAFKILSSVLEPKWNIISNYPFTMIANSSQPDRIYLARQTNNNKSHLIGIDLSQVGQLYALVQDLELN